MAQTIRDALDAEEIEAQAGTEASPDLFLSDFLSPVIFGPQRPPLASSGYFSGCVGLIVAGVALNTSQAGLFVSGPNVDSIVRVNRITIMNTTGGILGYRIRRVDDASGFTVASVVPGYIDAGNPNSAGLQTAIRSNTVGPQGTGMADVVVEATSLEHFDGPWILNNGALIASCSTVNTEMRVYMNYEHWPSIRRQATGG